MTKVSRLRFTGHPETSTKQGDALRCMTGLGEWVLSFCFLFASNLLVSLHLFNRTVDSILPPFSKTFCRFDG